MGTQKRNYEKSMPVLNPKQVQQELDYLVFTKDRGQTPQKKK